MGERMNILVVDDEPSMRVTLAACLENAGYAVVQAEDARVALEKLDGIDILVTDVVMPGMTGIELMHEARKQYPFLEVIIITAYATVKEAVAAINAGARAYLEKPVPSQDVLAHVQETAARVKMRKGASRFSRGGLVGSSTPMQRVYTEVDNVRELSNALERAAARGGSTAATRHHCIDLEALTGESVPGMKELSFRDARNRAADQWARGAIRSALVSENGNVTRAAKALRLHRTSLIRTMSKLGIKPDRP